MLEERLARLGRGGAEAAPSPWLVLIVILSPHLTDNCRNLLYRLLTTGQYWLLYLSY